MALVIHPMPELPQPPEEITADFMYLRLHGDRVVEHDYDYSDEELAVYAKKVSGAVPMPDHSRDMRQPDGGVCATQIVSWRERGLNVYVFFLNDTSGKPSASCKCACLLGQNLASCSHLHALSLQRMPPRTPLP